MIRGVPPRRLIPSSARRSALVVAVVAAMVVVVLAVLVHGTRGNGVDDAITRWTYRHFRSRWEAHALLSLSEPAFDVGVLSTLAVAAALRRVWNVAIFAVVAPVGAVLLSEVVLKPVVHRSIGGFSYPVGNAYPSGHETGIAALLAVLAVLALRTAWHIAVKVALVTALVVWAVLAAVGLVRNFLHYPSDTVGGASVAVAVVVVTALGIDAVTERRVRTRDDVGDEPTTARTLR
jgi:undecaprenyl-diphosphatase